MKTPLALATCICLSVACEGASTRMPEAPAPTSSRFSRAATAADAVFEGEVLALGPAPSVWSGRLAVYQTVTYRITKIVTDPGKRLSVGAETVVAHLLVSGSETADSQPRLRPALVAVGATVIVLAKWSDDHWTGVNEHYGVVYADAAHRAELAGR